MIRLLMTLLPSLNGLFISAGLGILLLTIHIVATAGNTGLLLPNLLGEDSRTWVTITTTYIKPLVDWFFSNPSIPIIAVAILWGVVGASSYEFFISSFNAIRNFHSINTPSSRFYALWFLWHGFIIGLAIFIFILLQPFIQSLYLEAEITSLASDLLEFAQHSGAFIGGWMLILHIYVVLWRFYKHYNLSWL